MVPPAFTFCGRKSQKGDNGPAGFLTIYLSLQKLPAQLHPGWIFPITCRFTPVTGSLEGFMGFLPGIAFMSKIILNATGMSRNACKAGYWLDVGCLSKQLPVDIV